MTFRHILLIAGVIVGTAVSAAAPHPVVLVSRTRVLRDVAGDTATVLAQGRIAAAMASSRRWPPRRMRSCPMRQ